MQIHRSTIACGTYLMAGLLIACGHAQVDNQNREKPAQVYTLPGEAVFPEGLAYDERQSKLYTGIQYAAGFNLNGIAATEDGRYLLTVQTNTGRLFRIDLSTQAIIEVSLNGGNLANGNGIDLTGNTLYVAQNQTNQVAVVQLADDYSRGEIVRTIQQDFQMPTAVAVAGNNLLVLNSQLDRRNAGKPANLPFTISTVAINN